MSGTSTFSIVAADPEAGEVGIGVQSKFLAAGALVPWARGGVGAVATQAFVEVTFGPRGLELLASGLAPDAVLERLLHDDERPDVRQVGIVDAARRSASHTGAGCFEHATSVTGPGYACQGNILASAGVVPAMARAFEAGAGLSAPGQEISALPAGAGGGGAAAGGGGRA